MVTGLIWVAVVLAFGFVILFIKNYRKALKDPDVQIASRLGMTMPIYRDCQNVFEERLKWHKNNEYDKTGYKNVRMPKNPNAYRKYEQYRFFVQDVNEWWMMSETERSIMSFKNPYEKEDYQWLIELNLPGLISDETAKKMWDDNEKWMDQHPKEKKEFLERGKREYYEDEDFLPACYEIDKPFPEQQYVSIGQEGSRAILNDEGFDVVISLSDITNEEIKSFVENEIYLSIRNVMGIPFVVLNFGNVFRVDFTLNIKKMEEGAITPWLNNRNEAYDIKLFLVEASNTNLTAIRRIPFDGMNYIREVCENQVHSTKEDVDSVIRMSMDYITIDSIEEKADKVYRYDNGLTMSSL